MRIHTAVLNRYQQRVSTSGAYQYIQARAYKKAFPLIHDRFLILRYTKGSDHGKPPEISSHNAILICEAPNYSLRSSQSPVKIALEKLLPLSASWLSIEAVFGLGWLVPGLGLASRIMLIDVTCSTTGSSTQSMICLLDDVLGFDHVFELGKHL